MKKIYSIFVLMLMSLVGFVAQASVEVNISCYSGYGALEVRDGGADGTLIPITSSYQPVTLEGDQLYIAVTGESYILGSVYYGSNYHTAPISNGVATIDTENLQDGDNVNISLSQIKTITVNVPDPTLVTCKKGSYGDTFDIVKGANKIKLGQYDSFYMELTDSENYRLTRFYRLSDNKGYSVTNFSYCSMYSGDIENGDTFSYVIVPADEFEAPTFKICVDDPSSVVVQSNYNDVEGLVANEWKTIEMTSSTSQIYVKHVVYGTELYSVKKNGVEQPGSYGSYSFSAEDGDEIVIKVEFPDEDYNISVSTLPAENIGYLKSVSIDGAEVENWQEGMVVHCGKKINFDLDNNLYILNGITVNGLAVDARYIYGTWEYKAVEDAEIVFDVEKKPTYTLTVNVKDATAVKCTLNYNEVKLQNGENIVEWTQDANFFRVEPATGATINLIKVTTSEGTERYFDSFGVYLSEEGTVIDIDADPMVRDQQFVAYFCFNPFGEYSYVQMYSTLDRVNRDVTPGYNVLDFATAEREYCVGWYPRTNSVAYLNGEALEENYAGGPFQFQVSDGDVLKVFDTKTPEVYTATFDVQATQAFTVKKDRIVDVDDLSAPISDLEDTEFTFIPEEEHKLSIKVSGATREDAPAIEANEDGTYTVVLDGDKTIVVADEKNTAIDEVIAAAAAQPADVYTVTGALVLRNATPAQIKSLPAGLYIVGGVKFVQK